MEDLISRAISELRLAKRDLAWVDARDHDSEHILNVTRTRIETAIDKLESAECYI